VLIGSLLSGNGTAWYSDVNRKVRPSELFRDHIFGCFISDSAGIYTGHLIAVDNIMFEGDYPHSDSNWPHTRKVLEEGMLDVPDGEARKMAELNDGRAERPRLRAAERKTRERLNINPLPDRARRCI